jgi:SAM-dependent methyltransferase/uncharacterized protein YbaR (Trm112 family)
MLSTAEMLDLLVCPACRQKLSALDRCDHCHARFSESDGTPVLIPSDVTRTVRFDFPLRRSTAGERFEACLSFPPRSGAARGDAPYHLDQAHKDVLDRLPAGASVLEIGCGGGQMRSYLQQRQVRYVGVDISKTRVYKELQRHGGPDVLCDAHAPPFPDGAFDVVYSAAVTEHLACPHLVVQEVARILKPGGYYLGNVSFLEPWHDHSFFHMTPLGAYELLTQAGFEIEHLWPGHGYSGYRSLMTMGNKVTKSLVWAGDLLYLLYRTGNRVRDCVRRGAKPARQDVLDAAKVAGATDWIARLPMSG